uniref:Inositol oxygenase n=1 Tax=Amphora coffeiformis TaxID=265554 RepID=A0A7S3LFE8_9STRA|mmetsp:Transcript_18457/g.35064  ORF Transcript_18457/g.35064 Transcript_18457/m.35064 type:complete len:320 (-) Transcript_18457:81-1040(-)
MPPSCSAVVCIRTMSTSVNGHAKIAVPPDLTSIKTNERKKEEDFRVYDEAISDPHVVRHYKDMRLFQTVDFYRRMEKKFSFENGQYRRLMTIEEAFDELEHYIDASDPDLELPNKLHLLQTAEGIRRAGYPDWMQVTGILHDMGKIMYLWGTSEDGQDGSTPQGKQWSLGGDTFVVGCRIPNDAVIFPQFNKLNPDMTNPAYNTEYGMYKPNCGLDHLCFAWGHDEYMWRMLVANETTIPREGLDIIRYHSAYPMHDKGAYRHLLTEADLERLEWIRIFNRFDLYTKDSDNDIRNNMDNIWPYYRDLLEKYGLGGKLKW